MPENWIFKYTKDEMEDSVLKRYQEKLIELKERYDKYIKDIPGCYFYKGDSAPPPDNIFADFKYKCDKHQPKCTGWTIFWNPNLVKDKTQLNGSFHNNCAPTNYKIWSKRIQAELELAFFDYFKLFHRGTGGDYYRLSDNYCLSFLPSDEDDQEFGNKTDYQFIKMKSNEKLDII